MGFNLQRVYRPISVLFFHLNLNFHWLLRNDGPEGSLCSSVKVKVLYPEKLQRSVTLQGHRIEEVNFHRSGEV